jgi:hypothetical protein
MYYALIPIISPVAIKRYNYNYILICIIIFMLKRLMNATFALKQNKIILNASVVVLKRVVSVLIISILKMNHVVRLVDWSACFFKNSTVNVS